MARLRLLSLRTALIAVFLSVMLVTLLLVALLLGLWSLPQLRGQVEHSHVRLARLAFAQFEASLDQTESASAAIARLLAGEDAAASSTDEEWRVELPALVEARDLFDGVYLLDAELRIRGMASAEVSAGQLDDWLGNDLSGVAVLQAARGGSEARWSDQFISPIHGRPVVCLVQPLRNGRGELLLFELSVERLANFARRAQTVDGLLTLVVDSKGELLAAPSQTAVQQRYNLANLSVLSLARAETPSERLQAFPWGGVEYLGLAQRSQRLGWSVLVAVPRAVLDAPQRSAVAIALGILLIASALGVLLFAGFARLIEARLRSSVDYARQITEGDYRPSQRASRISELGQLNHSLALMARRIGQREQELRGIVESAPNVAIQRYDRYGRVLAWNAASQALYGWTAEQAVGKTLDQLIFSPAQQAEFLAAIERLAQHGQPGAAYECEVRHRDGSLRQLLSSTFMVTGEEGEPVFVCMDVDISARKRAEAELRELNQALELRVEQRTASLSETNAQLNDALHSLREAQRLLVQSEKLAALGELVAGVAHELNTPIGNALMVVSTQAHQIDAFRHDFAQGVTRSRLEQLLDTLTKASEIATRNLNRAAELIASFKQVAVDRASSQRRHFSLRSVVDEVLLTLQPTLKRSPFRLELALAEGIELDSYPGPLGQVLTNLIQNALLHGLEGRDQGCIRIETGQLDSEHCWLQVSDDGVGIAEADLGRVLDPFYTTKLGQGGSGLGLHIVHNIVTGILGGRLLLQNADPTGLQVTLHLPLSAPPH